MRLVEQRDPPVTRPSEVVARHLVGLNATIRHALDQSPYYAETFAGLDPVLTTIGDLRRFPLLSRRTLVERGADLLAAGTVPEYVTITSGTTFGASVSPEPLLHYQTGPEREVEAELLAALSERAGAPHPLMLRLIVANHGVEMLPAVRGCFALPLEKPYHFAAVLSLLRRDYAFPDFTPRIRSLMGPLNLLKLLTLRCLEEGVDPASFGLERVTSYSWQLTSRWRALLEASWQAPVEDIYGVSELPGLTGHRCAACGRFHLSDLAVVEFLAPASDQPVDLGPARLIATALYPRVQAQPMIRYETGDIVDIGGMCPVTGRIGIEFMGRAHDVVFGPAEDGAVPWLWPMALNEALDGLPDVATNDDPRARTVGLRSGFGYLKYRLERRDGGGRRGIHLGIELRWSARQHPDAAIAFRERARERILESSPALRSAVETGACALDLELHEPGSTDFSAMC